MTPIPSDGRMDSTLSLLSEGYSFISNRCRRLGSDIFKTRILLREAFCVMGEEAARMFYHPERFTRTGAMPPTTLKLLQDRGSVQTLDGPSHRHRKQLFLSVMAPPQVESLTQVMRGLWQERVGKWAAEEEVVLHREVQEILCRAGCRWAGLSLTEEQVSHRTREFGAMIDGSGSVGPRNWLALWLRRRTERWGRSVIEDVRAGRLRVPRESAARAVADFRDPDGRLLDVDTAAVELINVLRPIVAVARFVTFAALALHRHPENRDRLRTGTDDAAECFAQEVRRYYPFFPVIAGRVLRRFEWRGHRFREGDWVLLDLYGTNHDPRTWKEPERFEPDRFRSWSGGAYDFIPQGGGDPSNGHRCPGERATIELVKAAALLLTGSMRYRVPEQDLRVDLSRMPALPASGFLMSEVRSAR